jgi:hypothetical protein
MGVVFNLKYSLSITKGLFICDALNGAFSNSIV